MALASTGKSLESNSAIVAAAVVSGPTISGVIVTPLKGAISWNAYSVNGVQSSSVKIDGATVDKIYGPYTANSGVNYSADFGSLSVGTHTYKITATDDNGVVSTITAKFTVKESGPIISNVVAAPLKGIISWNTYDLDGVLRSSVKIDGTTVDKLFGPITADSGVNYYANFGALSVGKHTYKIAATDDENNVSTLSGTFTVVKAGPTISVVVSQADDTITWNAYDINGVKSSSIIIDGKKVTTHGPTTAKSGVNYYASFDTLSVGKHTYKITATDNAGNVSTKTGTFTMSDSSSALLAAVDTVFAAAKWNKDDELP
jgi:hypothetical protein